MLDYAVWITQGLLAVAVLCAVYRVFRGPSVLDRVISVDVILVVVASMMIVDMVSGDHHDFILFVVVTAVIGFLGAVAIARYVVGRRPEDAAQHAAHGSERESDAAATSSQQAVMRAQVTEPEAPQQPVAAPSPEPAEEGSGEAAEDESTSWFTALARSGFVPKRREDAGEPRSGTDDASDAEGRTTERKDR